MVKPQQFMPKQRFIWSLALGMATSILGALAETYLPYGPTKERLIDAISTPGALIVGLLYPQGPHTGGGVGLWGYYVIAVNFVVYVLFWYAFVQLTDFLIVRLGSGAGSNLRSN
jgi:hypothetical protein